MSRRRFLVQGGIGGALFTVGAADGYSNLVKVIQRKEEAEKEVKEQRIPLPTQEALDSARHTLNQTSAQYKLEHRDEVESALKVQAQEEIFKSSVKERLHDLYEKSGEGISGLRLIGDIAAFCLGGATAREAASRWVNQKRIRKREAQTPQKA